MLNRVKEELAREAASQGCSEEYVSHVMIGVINHGPVYVSPVYAWQLINDELAEFLHGRQLLTVVHFINKYDMEMVSMYSYSGVIRLIIKGVDYKVMHGMGHGTRTVEDILNEAERLQDLAKDKFDETDGWDPYAPVEWNLSDDRRVESILGVEGPLIEPRYFIGHGITLRDKGELEFALSTGEITSDGYERNELIREYQLNKDKAKG